MEWVSFKRESSGQRAGSAVKSTYYSCRVPEFIQFSGSTPLPYSSKRSAASGFQWHLHLHLPTHTHLHTHTHSLSILSAHKTMMEDHIPKCLHHSMCTEPACRFPQTFVMHYVVHFPVLRLFTCTGSFTAFRGCTY